MTSQVERRPRTVDAALVAVAVLALTLPIAAHSVTSFDGSVMYAVTRSIAHGRLSQPAGQFPWTGTYVGPVFAVQFPYSHYGIGQSLAMLPFFLLGHAVGVDPRHVCVVVNPIIDALVAAAVCCLGGQLGWSRRLAAFVGLSTVLLTMLLWNATTAFSEPGVSLGIAVLLIGLVRLRRGRSAAGLLTGIGWGVAILWRNDSIALVGLPLLLVPLLLPRGERVGRIRRQLPGFVLPLLPVAAWTAYYSQLSSGTIFPHSYGGTFSTPLGVGLWGQLASPAKGFFWYDALLLLAIPGLVLLARRDLAWAALLLALWFVRALFFARWSYWYGGSTWGPRFLCPGVVPLAVASGAALQSIPTIAATWRRWLAAAGAAVLCAVGAVVNAASVWVSYKQVQNHAVARAVADTHSPVRSAALALHLELCEGAYNPIWYALRNLDHSAPFALGRLAHGPFVPGVVPLVLGAVLLVVLAARTRGSSGPKVRPPTTLRQTPVA